MTLSGLIFAIFGINGNFTICAVRRFLMVHAALCVNDVCQQGRQSGRGGRRGRGRRSRRGKGARDPRKARASEFPDDEALDDYVDEEDDDPDTERMHVKDVKAKPMPELMAMAGSLEIGAPRLMLMTSAPLSAAQ